MAERGTGRVRVYRCSDAPGWSDLMMSKHLDEARRAAIDTLRTMIEKDLTVDRIVLIDDLFGRLRVVAWIKSADSATLCKNIKEELDQVAQPYWNGEIWIASEGSEADRIVYERAWKEGRPVEESDRLRVADRYRSRGAWFQRLREPPWEVPAGPPIVVFYSFKGGVGRSTALASFAIQRARIGERVVVIDFDLDAPGVGSLLGTDVAGTTASWGVVDYLLERPYGEVDLRDYYHACRRDKVTGEGEILVVPVGRIDADYLGKLARIDFEPPADSEERDPLIALMEHIREALDPQWLLLDARTGLSDPAGLLLGGIAHLYVLFGTSSEQSWQGLHLVLDRLGAERVHEDRPQLECLLVQAMVPEDAKVSAVAKATFSDKARDEFAEHYYAQDPEDPDEDRFWYVRDLEDEDAPHVPVHLPYQSKLAHFERLDDIADVLTEIPEYRVLAERIAVRFAEGGD